MFKTDFAEKVVLKTMSFKPCFELWDSNTFFKTIDLGFKHIYKINNCLKTVILLLNNLVNTVRIVCVLSFLEWM